MRWASPEAGRYVSAALRAQGLAVDEVRASAIPASMHELVDYDLVILNNVSGFDLSLAKMELLEAYVRDAGGGVVKIGGDRSYAAGGYYATPVERLLPVTMNVKTEVKIRACRSSSCWTAPAAWPRRPGARRRSPSRSVPPCRPSTC